MAGVARQVGIDRHFVLPAPPAAVWSSLAATDRYRDRWPWLRRFEPDGGLARGSAWTCSVRAPLGYRVTFTIDLDEVDRAASVIAATVRGDINGGGKIALRPVGKHTELHLVTSAVPVRPLLRALTVVLRPVATWGHDRIIARGVHRLVAEMAASGPS